MTESEFFARFDRHLARADVHMDRGNKLIGENNKLIVENNQLIVESREVMRDHREFIREMTVRQERVTQQLVDEISANTRRIDAGTEQLRDMNLATKQHSQALARILDRLG